MKLLKEYWKSGSKQSVEAAETSDRICILVKYRYTKMYLKYIYFMLSTLQMHLHIYVLNKNTLQLYFWYTKLVYLKFAKLEKLILYLMHFNCVEVVLRSN